MATLKVAKIEGMGKALTLAGLGVGVLGFSSKDDKVATAGLITSALGLLMLGLEE